jgi:hypothetical protein
MRYLTSPAQPVAAAAADSRQQQQLPEQQHPECEEALLLTASLARQA